MCSGSFWKKIKLETSKSDLLWKTSDAFFEENVHA
jgi:hypothetical protein